MNEWLVSERMGVSVSELSAFLDRLALPSPAIGDAARIDRIGAMEAVKGALAAAQARETVVFRRSQLAEQRAEGVPERQLGRGIDAQVALARKESPHRQSRLCGLATALVAEMPHTMSALTAGEVSEWRVTLMVQETACLSLEHRRAVDEALGSRLKDMSDRQVRAEARREAYRLDPHAVVNRASRAAADRRVTSRPMPDVMMGISALLPAEQGAAVMAALARAVAAAKATGDLRTRGQLMADTLVERVTGAACAPQIPVEVGLQVTDRTLFGGGSDPGWLTGYGPVPAPWCRTLVRDLPAQTKSWIRRFFTDPCGGPLGAVDPTRRLVDGITRRAVVYRDVYCRTPYCGAPIRHLDHVIPFADGGETSETNTQGLCESCNHAKQATGWRSTPGSGGAGDLVEITTPTGHTHTSRPPPPLATSPPQQSRPVQRYPLLVRSVRWSDLRSVA